MHFKSLDDDQLHDETITAARKERQATLELLEYLAQVDARRLYNTRGFSSLWEYVHLALGYSEAQASERVAAMRFMERVPEVREKIATNALTLTSTAKLAAFVRREKCPPEKTLALVAAVSEKPIREVERILAAEQTVAHPKPDVLRPSGPETTRVSFDADPEFLALYEELRNLQGHQAEKMCERLKFALRTVLAKRTPKSEIRPPAKSEPNRISETAPSLRAPEVERSTSVSKKIRPTRYIPIAVRAATRARSGGQCEFVDSKSGRFDLEFDHIHPYSRGGPATAENIQLLCSSHNHAKAIYDFGIEKVPIRDTLFLWPPKTPRTYFPVPTDSEPDRRRLRRSRS
jgi:5-methylcytosine-specific restriction endonuclease McrA